MRKKKFLFQKKIPITKLDLGFGLTLLRAVKRMLLVPLIIRFYLSPSALKTPD